MANPKCKGLYPHPDGDFHTMVNIWNAAEWTHQMTQNWDPKDNQESEKLTKVWGKLNTSRRQYLMLKDHFDRTTEKCCKLLSVNVDRVQGTPRTDRSAATRLSMAIFKAYKSSLMVKELAGHYSSITEADEWRMGGYFLNVLQTLTGGYCIENCENSWQQFHGSLCPWRRC